MAVPVTVPRLGWSMEEGTFIEWLKQDGDVIRVGEPLFTLESDKSTETIEALDAGTLHVGDDGPQPGDRVKVGQVLGYIGAAVLERRKRVSSVSPAATPQALDEQNKAKAVMHHRTPKSDSEQAVTPRARRAARQLGIDPRTLRGSGRDGRIRERDVFAGGMSAGGRLIAHTTIRQVIASRMVAGVTQAAPVTLTTKADATALVALRQRLGTEASKPSYNDLLVQVVAAALRQHPMLQAQWTDVGLFVPDGCHIAVGVDTEVGLFAPVLRDADKLSLEQIMAETRRLIELARAGKLPAESQVGGTFTITNLGTFGIDAFTPIINLPQCAILGVGRIVREPAVVEEQIVPRAMVTLSLTFDHRIVDGAPAARFLDAVRKGIEKGGGASE